MSYNKKKEETFESFKYEENQILKYQLRKEQDENKKIKKEYFKKVLSNENDIYKENKNLQTQLNLNLYQIQLFQHEKEKLQNQIEKQEKEIEQTKEEYNLLMEKMKNEIIEKTEKEKIKYYNTVITEKNQEIQNIMEHIGVMQHKVIESINRNLENICKGNSSISIIPITDYSVLGNVYSIKKEIHNTNEFLETIKETKHNEIEWKHQCEELINEKNEMLLKIDTVEKDVEKSEKEKQYAYSRINEIQEEKEKVIQEKEQIFLDMTKVNEEKKEIEKIKESYEYKIEELIKSNEDTIKEQEQLLKEQTNIISINEELFKYVNAYVEQNELLREEKQTVETEFKNYQNDLITNAQNSSHNKKWNIRKLKKRKKVFTKNNKEKDMDEHIFQKYLSKTDIIQLLQIKQKLKKEHNVNNMHFPIKRKKTRRTHKEKRELKEKEIKKEKSVEFSNKTAHRIRKRVFYQKSQSHPKKRRSNFYFYYKDFQNILLKNIQTEKRMNREKEQLREQLVDLKEKEKKLKEENEQLVKEIKENKKNKKEKKELLHNSIFSLFRLLENESQQEKESVNTKNEEIRDLYSEELVKKIKIENEKNTHFLLIKQKEIDTNKQEKKKRNKLKSFVQSNGSNSVEEDTEEDCFHLQHNIGKELESLLTRINKKQEDDLKCFLKKEKEHFEKEFKIQIEINDKKKWEHKIEEIQLDQKNIYEQKLKQMKEDEQNLCDRQIKDIKKKHQQNNLTQENWFRMEKEKYEKKIVDVEKREKSKYELKVKQLVEEENKNKRNFEEQIKEIKQKEKKEYEQKLNTMKKEEQFKIENSLRERIQKEERKKYEDQMKEFDKRQQKTMQEKIEIEKELKEMIKKEALKMNCNNSFTDINYAKEVEHIQNTVKTEYKVDSSIQKSESMNNPPKLKKHEPVKLKEMVDFFNLNISELTEEDLVEFSKNDFFRNNLNIFTKQDTEIIRMFLHILCEWKQMKWNDFEEANQLKEKEKEEFNEKENEKKHKGIQLSVFYKNISNTLDLFTNESVENLENDTNNNNDDNNNKQRKKELLNEMANQIKECIRIIALIRTKNITIVNMKKDMEKYKQLEELKPVNYKDKDQKDPENILVSSNHFNEMKNNSEEGPNENTLTLENRVYEKEVLIQKIKELQKLIKQNNTQRKEMEEKEKEDKESKQQPWKGISFYKIKKKNLRKKEKIIQWMKTDLKKIIKIQKKVKEEIEICRTKILQMNVSAESLLHDQYEKEGINQIRWMQEVDKITSAYVHLLKSLKRVLTTWNHNVAYKEIKLKLSGNIRNKHTNRKTKKRVQLEKNENEDNTLKEKESTDPSIHWNEIIKEKTLKLEKLKKSVSTLQDENTNLCRDIESLKETIKKKTKEYEMLKENYSTLKYKEQSLRHELSYCKNEKVKCLEDNEIKEHVEQMKYLMDHKKYEQVNSEITRLFVTYKELKQSHDQLKTKIEQIRNTQIKKEKHNINNSKTSNNSNSSSLNHSMTEDIKQEKENEEESRTKKTGKLELFSFLKKNENKQKKHNKSKKLKKKKTINISEEFHASYSSDQAHKSMNDKDSNDVTIQKVEKEEKEKKSMIPKRKKRKNRKSKKGSIIVVNDSPKEISENENQEKKKEVMKNSSNSITEIESIQTEGHQSVSEKPEEETTTYGYKNNFIVNFFMNQYPGDKNMEEEKEVESNQEEKSNMKHELNDTTMKVNRTSSEEMENEEEYKYKHNSDIENENEKCEGDNGNEEPKEASTNIIEENVFNVFNKFFY